MGAVSVREACWTQVLQQDALSRDCEQRLDTGEDAVCEGCLEKEPAEAREVEQVVLLQPLGLPASFGNAYHLCSTLAPILSPPVSSSVLSGENF